MNRVEAVRRAYRIFVQQMQRKHESMRVVMDRRTIWGFSEFVQCAQMPVVAAAPVTRMLLVTVLFGAITRTTLLLACGVG